MAGVSATVNSERSDVDAMTEQQRIQQQLHVFQSSLPKVNELAYQLLFNEIIPLSMAVEKKLLNKTNLQDDQKVAKQDDDKATKDFEKLHINASLDAPSHKMCQEISESDQTKQERVFERVRNIGFQIGNKITELLVFSNNPNLRFKDMDLLAIMKFICRDVWKQLFGKQIDNLKTNHRGTFYLFDYDYRPIQSFSLESGSAEKELALVKPFLELPIGIIMGVLSSLGYSGEEVQCMATFVNRPDDRPKSTFHKGISFHVQVNSQ